MYNYTFMRSSDVIIRGLKCGEGGTFSYNQTHSLAPPSRVANISTAYRPRSVAFPVDGGGTDSQLAGFLN